MQSLNETLLDNSADELHNFSAENDQFAPTVAHTMTVEYERINVRIVRNAQAPTLQAF